MSSQVGGIARAPVSGANPFLTIIAGVATTIPYCCAKRRLATSWLRGDRVVVLDVCSRRPGATLTHAAIWWSRDVCRAVSKFASLVMFRLESTM